MKIEKSLILLVLIMATFNQANSHPHHDEEHSSQQSHNQQTNQNIDQNDDTQSMMVLSKLIVSTIQKYDNTGKGVIPLQRYAQFMHQIFIQGSKLDKMKPSDEQIPQQVSKLLKKATQQFKQFRYSQQAINHLNNQQQSEEQKISANKRKQKAEKKQKKQYVQLQEFYMDLIKHFSEFIDLQHNRESYKLLNEYFFEQDKQQQQKRARQQQRQKQREQQKNNRQQQSQQQQQL